MADVLVVADDLTGGNATGVLFARRGMRVLTVAPGSQPPPGVDVLVVNTDTRRASPDAAAHLVDQVIRGTTPRPELLVKRIDTTLRGPVGAELEAALRARAATSSTDVRAVAAPAHPGAGRTTVGGIHLVDGVPLADGAVAADPFTPVTESRVGRVLTAGTSLDWREVHLDTVRQGVAATAEALADALAAAPVAVLDAVTERDLRVGAEATAAVAGQRWDVVAVDSGPFGAALSGALRLLPRTGSPDPVLLVVASLAERTAEQLARAHTDLDAVVVDVTADDAAALDAASLCGRLREAMRRAAADGQVRAAGWRLVPGRRLEPDRADDVVATLAAAAERTVAAGGVHGVFASGGDMAAALVPALSATGFAVHVEVQPLVVAGHLTGGPHDGLPFATKGGLIGGHDAIVAAVAQLHTMEEAHDPGTAARTDPR